MLHPRVGRILCRARGGHNVSGEVPSIQPYSYGRQESRQLRGPRRRVPGRLAAGAISAAGGTDVGGRVMDHSRPREPEGESDATLLERVHRKLKAFSAHW